MECKCRAKGYTSHRGTNKDCPRNWRDGSEIQWAGGPEMETATERREAVFEIDGLPGKFEGVTHGRTWNGWACPSFTPEVAQKIADAWGQMWTPDWMEDRYRAEFRHEDKVFRFWDPTSGEWDEFGPLKDGLYPIGTGCWTWTEVEPDTCPVPGCGRPFDNWGDHHPEE